MSVAFNIQTHNGMKTVHTLRQFNVEDCSAYVYSLEQFFDFNEARVLTPIKGKIGGVLVDGELMNINVENWPNYYGWANNFVWMSLRDLEGFYPCDVRIIWYYGE